jgi:hypothetical protein
VLGERPLGVAVVDADRQHPRDPGAIGVGGPSEARELARAHLAEREREERDDHGGPAEIGQRDRPTVV